MGNDIMRRRSFTVPRRRAESGFCPSLRQISLVLILAFVAYIFTGCFVKHNGGCFFRRSDHLPVKSFKRDNNLANLHLKTLIQDNMGVHAAQHPPAPGVVVPLAQKALQASQPVAASTVDPVRPMEVRERKQIAQADSEAHAAAAEADGKSEQKSEKVEEVDLRFVKDVQEGRGKKPIVEVDKVQGDPRGDSKDPLPGQDRNPIIVPADEGDAGHLSEDEKKDGKKEQPKENHEHIAEEDKDDSHKWHYAGHEDRSEDKQALPTIHAPAARLEFVKQMIHTAWQNYVKFAWGLNTLFPVQGIGSNEQPGLGGEPLALSLVEALDTLYIANMTEEFNRGRAWVAQNLTFSNLTSSTSALQLSKRMLGSLLSTYALSGDKMFLSKAVMLGEHLLKILQPSPDYSQTTIEGVHAATLAPNGRKQAACSHLSEIGGLHMELSYLSRASGERKFLDVAKHIRHLLTSKDVEVLPGIPSQSLRWDAVHQNLLKCSDDATVGDGADGYFDHLLKSVLLDGNTAAKQAFENATKSIQGSLLEKLFVGNNVSYWYIDSTKKTGEFHQSTCYTAAMFGLASKVFGGTSGKEYLSLGEEIAKTCRFLHTKSDIGIAPDSVTFVRSKTLQHKLYTETAVEITLQPQVAEAYFVLSRLTNSTQYADWAIELAQAIDRHCRMDNGFSVRVDGQPGDLPVGGRQPSHFLGATLKYLFLTLSKSTVVPLDRWVFNSAGHVFPIAVSRGRQKVKSSSRRLDAGGVRQSGLLKSSRSRSPTGRRNAADGARFAQPGLEDNPAAGMGDVHMEGNLQAKWKTVGGNSQQGQQSYGTRDGNSDYDRRQTGVQQHERVNQGQGLLRSQGDQDYGNAERTRYQAAGSHLHAERGPRIPGPVRRRKASIRNLQENTGQDGQQFAPRLGALQGQEPRQAVQDMQPVENNQRLGQPLQSQLRRSPQAQQWKQGSQLQAEHSKLQEQQEQKQQQEEQPPMQQQEQQPAQEQAGPQPDPEQYRQRQQIARGDTRRQVYRKAGDMSLQAYARTSQQYDSRRSYEKVNVQSHIGGVRPPRNGLAAGSHGRRPFLKSRDTKLVGPRRPVPRLRRQKGQRVQVGNADDNAGQ